MSKIKNSQCTLVLNHIKTHGHISNKEAIEQYGVMRLASRISDLKKRGYMIDSFFDTAINRYGQEVRFKRYYLVDEDGASSFGKSLDAGV